MGKIVIKRKVTLEFLGEEYKDGYLTFKAIPVKDYTGMLAKLPKEGEEDNGKSITMMLDLLTTYFVEGKFPDDEGKLQDVTKEDVGDIDQETAIHCFETVVGKKTDPKD
jgi:hypothetical protein